MNKLKLIENMLTRKDKMLIVVALCELAVIISTLLVLTVRY
jgi:hypothetical protein